mmetsp:Transcript_12789/g.20476  ORF Transcript_12789/g.20476 Transcript_12789/m.20476 type:complete len:387 (-) Transcript_12789:181-1341(-)
MASLSSNNSFAPPPPPLDGEEGTHPRTSSTASATLPPPESHAQDLEHKETRETAEAKLVVLPLMQRQVSSESSGASGIRSWSIIDVSDFVAGMGKDQRWLDYAQLVAEKKIDGGRLVAANMQFLCDQGFHKNHASKVMREVAKLKSLKKVPRPSELNIARSRFTSASTLATVTTAVPTRQMSTMVLEDPVIEEEEEEAPKEMSGWLWKSGRINTAMQKRWFSFDADQKKVKYFKDENAEKPLGEVMLDNAVLSLQTEEDKNAINLALPGLLMVRNMIIKAEKREVLDAWIRVFRSHTNVKLSDKDQHLEDEKERHNARVRAAKRAKETRKRENKLIEEMGRDAYNKMLEEEAKKVKQRSAEERQREILARRVKALKRTKSGREIAW